MEKQTKYTAQDGIKIFFNVFFISLIATFMLSIIYSITAGQMNITMSEFLNFEVVKYINAFIMEVLFVIIYFCYMKSHSISVVKSNKLNVALSWQQLATIIVLAGFIYVFSAPFCNCFESFLMFTGYKLNALSITLNNPLSIILALIFLAIVPAFIEEFIFRGALLQGFKKYGKWFAILMSALLFTLIHGNVQQTIYQFGCGIIFALLVWETGSIWSSVILHLTNNSISIILQTLIDCKVIALQSVQITWIYVVVALILLVALAFIIMLSIKILNRYALQKQGNSTSKNNTIINNNEQKLEDTIIEEENVLNIKSNINLDIPELSEEVASNFKDGFAKFKNDKKVLTLSILSIATALLMVILNTIGN